MADASETRGPDGTVTAPAPPSPSAGLRIGPYKVLREVGHGGMGAVYLAARADDQYQKRVAIKVVKSGAFGEDAVRHFRRERQILASLDHPNIAKLLDGGATDEGLPYIVMDHIEGQPIDRYCDANQLSTADRLKLFGSVCGAVQYAHRNLVVHRDIKPSNVLVTTDGVPKLLDFGVAKLLNPEISGEPLTATGMAMTPEYASPEQARGEAITTATDVYSLGVLLYELLTGRRPYRLKSRKAIDVLRAVCEEEPERPSTAVGRTEELPATDGAASTLVTAEAVSQARAATPDKLQRRLKGDLDNIVMMALRKEPQRRYPSVEALSEDIRRHLQGLPRDGGAGHRRPHPRLRRDVGAPVEANRPRAGPGGEGEGQGGEGGGLPGRAVQGLATRRRPGEGGERPRGPGQERGEDRHGAQGPARGSSHAAPHHRRRLHEPGPVRQGAASPRGGAAPAPAAVPRGQRRRRVDPRRSGQALLGPGRPPWRSAAAPTATTIRRCWRA